MHKIGDNVVYGGNGVMTVIDIREEMFADTERSYYVLREALGRSESLTYVPLDNEALVSQMRPLLTKEEVMSVISSSVSAPDCQWASDSRSRTECFRRIMESGDRAKILAMIRTIKDAGIRREEEGKKNFVSDENAQHKAEKLIAAEFSIVLGIAEEEVFEFIKKQVEK